MRKGADDGLGGHLYRTGKGLVSGLDSRRQDRAGITAPYALRGRWSDAVCASYEKPASPA